MNNYTTQAPNESKNSTLYSSKKQLTLWEQVLAHKLGYEWKNIFRMMLQLDKKFINRVELTIFDEVCQNFKIHISPDELTKIKKNYCDIQETE